jgi:hypothetical protein
MAATTPSEAVFYMAKKLKGAYILMTYGYHTAEDRHRLNTEVENWRAYGDCRGAEYLSQHPESAGIQAARTALTEMASEATAEQYETAYPQAA